MKITVNSIKKHIMNMDGLHLLTLFIAGYVLIYVLISMVNRYGGIVEGLSPLCDLDMIYMCLNHEVRMDAHAAAQKAAHAAAQAAAKPILVKGSMDLFNANYIPDDAGLIEIDRLTGEDRLASKYCKGKMAASETGCKVAETDVQV